jgi:hypothetical protein
MGWRKEELLAERNQASCGIQPPNRRQGSEELRSAQGEFSISVKKGVRQAISREAEEARQKCNRVHVEIYIMVLTSIQLEPPAHYSQL